MNKALFLDRDGVINQDYGYVYEISKLVILDGIVELCKTASLKDYLLIVVTNQSGIGRGYYTEEQFWQFMHVIELHFAKHSIKFTKIYLSPYHPEAQDTRYQYGEELRKPNPGMILQAQKEFNINLAQSILIGDKITDIRAGLKAGVGRNILFCDIFKNIF